MTTVAALIAACLAWISALFAGAPHVVRNVFVPAPLEARILFAGDMMFDRSVRMAALEHGDDFLFSCLASTLRDADIVVANLEGPVTTHDSMSVGSIVGSGENVTFTFPTSTATLLKRHNISLVNLGNNHIMNFGREGAEQTTKWLDAAGVMHFGDPVALTEAARVKQIELDSIPFSFVSWSDWTGGEKEEVIAQIARERAMGRIVVVYTHWGDEYVSPNERIQSLAREFIDSGAEIVIGSHPHVVLEHEIYNGKYIYYSLGNFIFDQYFNEAVRKGLMLNIVFDRDGVESIVPIPTYLERDRRTCLK
jgi:poly-gamma-glutamate capsule biosynthesis protein CapA/YwtB (metallophosphatase superfamily)